MVSTSKMHGTPVVARDLGDAPRRLVRHEVEVRRVAADHRAEADHRVVRRPDRARRSAVSGISNAPGTQATVDVVVGDAVPARARRAPRRAAST